ncbi:hypothetical protein ENBRE01_2795, partial [Enteropsectra breve]
MFERILTHDEERAVCTQNALVIEANADKLSEYFSIFESIPQYLKRVKKVDAHFYVIVQMIDIMISNECLDKKLSYEEIKAKIRLSEKISVYFAASSCTFRIVEVPAFSPCTSKQYNDACAYWPCHYTYRIYETPDFALAHEM